MLLSWLLSACGGPVDLNGKAEPEDTEPRLVASTPCDACGGDCVVEELEYGEAFHVEGGVDYVDAPPAGGPHDPCWAPFGVHDEAVPDERFVHNLEHGAIVVLHECDGCAEVADLEAWAAGSEWALVTPYPGLDAPFVGLAWGFRATWGCWDEAAVAAFYDAHVDQGPESVLADPSAACME